MQQSSALTPPGWQARLAAELADRARSDPRVLEMRVHGSAKAARTQSTRGPISI